MRVRFRNAYGGKYNGKKRYTAPHNSNGYKFSKRKTHGFHNSSARKKFYAARKKGTEYFRSWRKNFRFKHGLRTTGHNNF